METVIWYAPFIAIPVLCLISCMLIVFLVKKPKTQDRSEKKSLKQFLTGINEILQEKGRWLYAIFAIGGLLIIICFSQNIYFMVGFLYLSGFGIGVGELTKISNPPVSEKALGRKGEGCYLQR